MQLCRACPHTQANLTLAVVSQSDSRALAPGLLSQRKPASAYMQRKLHAYLHIALASLRMMWRLKCMFSVLSPGLRNGLPHQRHLLHKDLGTLLHSMRTDGHPYTHSTETRNTGSIGLICTEHVRCTDSTITRRGPCLRTHAVPAKPHAALPKPLPMRPQSKGWSRPLSGAVHQRCAKTPCAARTWAPGYIHTHCCTVSLS